jgi:hypothetical protein
MFEPERAVFARRRVRLALGVGEERGRSDRGAFLFGNFFLGKQEKVTCRGSATHKFISYLDRAPTGAPRKMQRFRNRSLREEQN